MGIMQPVVTPFQSGATEIKGLSLCSGIDKYNKLIFKYLYIINH